jgi:pSer/pThr/pTyr-binding forkhead associated (FHA) protein
VATSVSRRHARIEVSAAGAILEDLGSLNGTFVGDRRVDAPTALHEGDEIRIGRERLRFIGNQKVRARTQPM